MVLPCTSVIVIIVLLNVALTCATPEAMFLRSRRRTRVASFPILNPFAERHRPSGCRHLVLRDALFLLAGNRFGRTFAGACVGVGTLPAHREAAAVAQATVAAKVHQPLDVHRNFAPQIALDDIVAVDHLAQLQHFLIGQLRYPARVRHRYLVHDFLSFGRANAVDILQGDDDALVGWDIDASDTSHVISPCADRSRTHPDRRRYVTMPMSPEKATNVKRQRMPAATAWHRCHISNWIFRAY